MSDPPRHRLMHLPFFLNQKKSIIWNKRIFNGRLKKISSLLNVPIGKGLYGFYHLSCSNLFSGLVSVLSPESQFAKSLVRAIVRKGEVFRLRQVLSFQTH